MIKLNVLLNMNTNLKKFTLYLITEIVVYDLETYNKDRAVPYCSCIYKLSKISGRYNRDITERNFKKV